MNLKTNYVDSQYSQKKYLKTEIDASTITLVDTTEYTVSGDYYGAEDLNLQNLTCNELNHNFSYIDELVRILRDERGITVANNSPAAILAALQTDKENFYNTGIANGKAYVKNHPTDYGFVPYSEYQAAYNTNISLKGKRDRAKGYLNAIPSYNPPQGTPSYSFSSDPITDAQATRAKNSINPWLNQIFDAFIAFCSTGTSCAIAQINKAISELML